MTYEWLLFDADGTLFDYDHAEIHSLRETFRELDLPFDEAVHAAYRRVNGGLWEDFERGLVTATTIRTRRFELLFAAKDLRADPESASSTYLRHLSLAAFLVDGAECVVEALGMRHRLALVTNGLHDVQRSRLALSPFAHAFEHVAVSEEIGSAKPERGFFDAVFAAIGGPPKESALLIGDSLSSDIRGGLDYDLDTCWFNPAGRPPDPACVPMFEIRRLEELLDLLVPNGGGPR